MNKTKKLIQINQRVMLLVGMTLALFALVLMPVKAHAAALAAEEPLPVMASSSSATQASSTTSENVVDQPMTESPVVEGPPVVRTETDTEVDQPEQSAVTTADSVVEDDDQPASPSTYNSGKDITDSVKVHQQLYDDHKQAIDEAYAYEIYDQQRLKVNSHFELSDDLADQIQAGDHFEVTLPENLVMSDTTSHNLIASDTDVASSTQPKWVVGTYQLTLGDGPKLLTVTFNDFLANHRAVKNLVGDIDIHGLAKLGELEVTSKTGGVTDINVKPRPSSDVTAETYHPSDKPITKQGFQVPDYDGGPTTEVNWVLDINTDGLVEALETGTTSHTMTNTMIYDNLTLGQTVSERSTPRVTVPVYYRNATGKVLAISGTRLEVRIENEVTVAQVAAANHENETAVTFSQFDNYVKQHLGAYGYFKQTSDGRLFDQDYQAGQITFVMNLGDLGAPTATGHQLHLAAQTEENAEAQIQRELPTGTPDLTQTLAGYRHLLTATAGTGIAGLHVEFLMHETADVNQTLANTAILTHNGQSTSSNKCAILYDSTESHVALTLAKGVIRIQKSAVALDETGNYPALAGVVFNITDAAGQIVARLVTNANGIAETAELPSGDYLISEMRSVAGYEPVMLADVSGTRLGDGHAYSVTIDRGSDEHGLLVNIFNQKTPTTTITVTKRWRDVPTGVVTPDVEAVLLVNGDPTTQSVTLTPLNHYVGQFNGLALTDAAGKVIRYSVREIPVEGYTAENEGLAPVVNGQAILVNDYLVPDQPKDPKTPNVPDEPKTPIVPETPVTPTTPETPVTPTTPETPVTPTTPETPVTPETPTIPETPNTPEEPATPETPDFPSPSTVPETPTASANENEQLPASAVKKANTQTMMTVSTPATVKAKAVSTTTTSATRLPQTNDRGRSSMISLLGLLLLVTICLVADPLTRRQ